MLRNNFFDIQHDKKTIVTTDMQSLNNKIDCAIRDGNEEFILSLIKKNHHGVHYAAFSSAYYNNTAILSNIIKTQGETASALIAAFEGAGCAGNETLIYELIKEYGNKSLSIRSAIWGAAARGHEELTFKLIQDGGCPKHALLSAARGRHSNIINKLLADKCVELEDVVWSIAKSNCLHDEEQAVQQFIDALSDQELRHVLTKQVKKNGMMSCY